MAMTLSATRMTSAAKAVPLLKNYIKDMTNTDPKEIMTIPGLLGAVSMPFTFPLSLACVFTHNYGWLAVTVILLFLGMVGMIQNLIVSDRAETELKAARHQQLQLF
jgi:hypothetical protein